MSWVQRPLVGWAVGLSISESDDSAERGFPLWQVNRVTLQLVSALFGQGVRLIFGHDWREDGVMEAVHGFARQVEAPLPLSSAEADTAGQPFLRNVLPWPDAPRLPALDLDRLSSTLRVESAGLPVELRTVETQALHAGRGSPLYQYVRARGLTFLRHRLGELCDARLCLGGRASGYEGRYPGVIEEALLSLRRTRLSIFPVCSVAPLSTLWMRLKVGQCQIRSVRLPRFMIHTIVHRSTSLIPRRWQTVG